MTNQKTPTLGELITIVSNEAAEEYRRALYKFPRKQASLHESFAVLKEEVDELWDAIKNKDSAMSQVREEAIQVAAMAIRMICDVCDDRGENHA